MQRASGLSIPQFDGLGPDIGGTNPEISTFDRSLDGQNEMSAGQTTIIDSSCDTWLNLKNHGGKHADYTAPRDFHGSG